MEKRTSFPPPRAPHPAPGWVSTEPCDYADGYQHQGRLPQQPTPSAFERNGEPSHPSPTSASPPFSPGTDAHGLGGGDTPEGSPTSGSTSSSPGGVTTAAPHPLQLPSLHLQQHRIDAIDHGVPSCTPLPQRAADRHSLQPSAGAPTPSSYGRVNHQTTAAKVEPRAPPSTQPSKHASSMLAYQAPSAGHQAPSYSSYYGGQQPSPTPPVGYPSTAMAGSPFGQTSPPTHPSPPGSAPPHQAHFAPHHQHQATTFPGYPHFAAGPPATLPTGTHTGHQGTHPPQQHHGQPASGQSGQAFSFQQPPPAAYQPAPSSFDGHYDPGVYYGYASDSPFGGAYPGGSQDGAWQGPVGGAWSGGPAGGPMVGYGPGYDGPSRGQGWNPNATKRQRHAADPLDKPHKCSYCDRGFGRDFDRKRHERTMHTKDKIYTCALCGDGFVRSDNLKRHKKTGCNVDKSKRDDHGDGSDDAGPSGSGSGSSRSPPFN